MPRSKMYRRNKRATHEYTSFLNPSAETSALHMKRPRSTDCISGYLVFEGKDYSDRVAIIGFLFWLRCNILNKHVNGGIYKANWTIKSAHSSLRASDVDIRACGFENARADQCWSAFYKHAFTESRLKTQSFFATFF